MMMMMPCDDVEIDGHYESSNHQFDSYVHTYRRIFNELKDLQTYIQTLKKWKDGRDHKQPNKKPKILQYCAVL